MTDQEQSYTLKQTQSQIDMLPSVCKETLSDGYHSFKDLYDHRIALYIALCKSRKASGASVVWKTTTHSDGTSWDGWFALGMNTKTGQQITYHLPISEWDNCSFATSLTAAPNWDDHTPADVLQRLREL